VVKKVVIKPSTSIKKEPVVMKGIEAKESTWKTQEEGSTPMNLLKTG